MLEGWFFHFPPDLYSFFTSPSNSIYNYGYISLNIEIVILFFRINSFTERNFYGYFGNSSWILMLIILFLNSALRWVPFVEWKIETTIINIFLKWKYLCWRFIFGSFLGSFTLGPIFCWIGIDWPFLILATWLSLHTMKWRSDWRNLSINLEGCVH